MKRGLVIGLILTACLLAGCGKTDKKETKETVKEVAKQEVSDYSQFVDQGIGSAGCR